MINRRRLLYIFLIIAIYWVQIIPSLASHLEDGSNKTNHSTSYPSNIIKINSNDVIAQNTPHITREEEFQEKIATLEKELAEIKEFLKKQRFSLNLNPDTMLKLSGFVQMRAYDSQTTINTHETLTDLDLRRVRVGFGGDIGKKSFLQYSFDLGRSGVVTRDAFFDYRFFPWLLVRAGQFKLPFTHEILLSGSDVIFERSLATLRLFPSARERGFMWDVDLERFIHIPLFVQFGVTNGTGLGQGDNNFAKDIFTSVLFKKKYFDARASFQTGRYEFEPSNRGEVSSDKRRVVLSLHSNFGFGKNKLWDGYGSYMWAHSDFPKGSYAIHGTFGLTSDFNNEDINGYNIVLTRRLYKDSPLILWGKYDRFDPNIHSSGNTIDIISYGMKYDLTSQFSILGGVFHKNFRSVGKDVSLGLQTQLKY